MYQPQYQLVASPPLCASLQASGLPTNLKRDILSGPISQLGLNNGYTYGTLGQKHIGALMDHRGNNTTTGIHMIDMIDSHKLEIGCSGYLFEKNFQDLYQSITPSWISHTWQFMCKNNPSIGETTAHLIPQIQNDLFIMEILMATGIKGNILEELKIYRN